MKFPSKLINDAVAEFAGLPGIGEKTALRLVLHLLKEPVEKVEHFGSAIALMRKEIKFCKTCHNVSDHDECIICTSQRRNEDILCVVENIRDVLAIESTETFQGKYHVLGGVISPIDGVGPDDLNIDSLKQRIAKGEVKEMIMALSATIDGDTTVFYLSKLLKDTGVKITTIARGVAFGGELEYTDDLTLSRSISNRLPYDNYMSNKE